MSPAHIEQELRRFFEASDPGVVAAYLYGSVARGSHTAESDVDVAILLDETPPRTLDGLPFPMEARLEAILHRPVSIVVLNTASPDLAHRVLRDGRVVLDRDRGRRIRFEVQSRNEYFDLVPLLMRYRRRS